MAKKPNTKKDYEELGKIVASIYESGYLDVRKSYKNSFIKGMLSGLGGVIGATLVLALLLWVLSLFSRIPLLDRYVDNVKQTIEKR